MTTTAAPARVYARISLDTEEKGLGVERQEQDCRTYAAAHGMHVVDVYVDNSVSAYSGKVRPAFDRLKADLARGDTVLVYDNSRLGRNAVEQLGFIEHCYKSGITVISVVDDTVLTDPQQNLMTGVRAIVAQEESRKIGERVRRAKQQKAQSGQPLKARYRTFGYTDDFKVVSDEAAAVQEAFKRLAAGHSVYSIFNWLVSQFPTNPVTGNPFKYNTVLSMLDNPRYAGFNVYKGEVIGKGTQDQIISEDMWHAANANRYVRNKKHNYGVRNGANARKFLLTGFVFCSACFSQMVSHKVKDREMSYRCSKINGGCGKLGMKMQWVDDAVSWAVVSRLQTEILSPTPAAPDYADEIAAAQQRIEEVQAAYNAGQLAMADMLPMLNAARNEMNALQKKQGQVAVAAQRQQFPFFQNYKTFKTAELSQRRALVASVVKTVVILPVNKPSKTVDLSRIEVHWSDGTVENLGANGESAAQAGVYSPAWTQHTG